MQNNTTNLLFRLKKYIFAIVLMLSVSNSFGSDLSDEIRSYIENIKSIAVEFKQSDQNGYESGGMLIIDKPYKFRCNYYYPFPILIVGNKNYVSVYDHEMENLSRIKAQENIFYFLLVDKINFDKQFEIISAKTEGEEYIIKLKHADLNKMSEIIFNKKSKHIKQMQIFEENNVITLNFAETKRITDVSKSLFIIKDPDIFGKINRLNKKQLEKKFKLAS